MMTMTEMTALEKKRKQKIEDDKAQEVVLNKQIPKPVGYRILIALPSIDETYGESGLLKSEQTMRDEYILSMIGVVLDVGDQAYADTERFPTGPWCKQGDYVMFRANSGTRFKVGRQE